jgi:hypothetical protein
MNKTHMMMMLAGLFIAAQWAKQRKAADVITATEDWRDGSNWYEDSWARLHGRDLSLDGNHPIPSHLSVYGVSNEMGWSYGWDGTLTLAANT